MLTFSKMHGIGNDYIYINCFQETVTDPEKLSIFMSNVRFGVGSDGLVLILPSEVADFRMRIFNADGSEAMTKQFSSLTAFCRIFSVGKLGTLKSSRKSFR